MFSFCVMLDSYLTSLDHCCVILKQGKAIMTPNSEGPRIGNGISAISVTTRNE